MTMLGTLQEELTTPIYLFYNGEVFQYLQGHMQNWELLLSSLYEWRKTVPEQINLDYDGDPYKTLAELGDVPGSIWYKLVSNEKLWSAGVLNALFPSGRALRLLDASFRKSGGSKLYAGRKRITFLQLSALLQMQLDKYYPR